jgi:hypothetical protein
MADKKRRNDVADCLLWWAKGGRLRHAATQ